MNESPLIRLASWNLHDFLKTKVPLTREEQRLVEAIPAFLDLTREVATQMSSAQARSNPQVLDGLERMALEILGKLEK